MRPDQAIQAIQSSATRQARSEHPNRRGAEVLCQVCYLAGKVLLMSSWFAKSNWRRVASGPAGVLKWPKYAGELLWELRCGRRPIYIDYPPQVRPRYGYGSPPHAGLYALMSGQLVQFSSVTTALGEYAQDLARISAEQPQ